MARPTLFGHPKFRKLCRLLGNKAEALGSLEFLWQSSWDAMCPDMDSSDDIESACQWSGEHGVLTRFLVDSGFLEKRRTKYRIHDWRDHLPEYVQKRIKREDSRRQSGHGPDAVQSPVRTTAAKHPTRRAGQGRTGQDKPPNPQVAAATVRTPSLPSGHSSGHEKGTPKGAYVERPGERPDLDPDTENRAALLRQKYQLEGRPNGEIVRTAEDDAELVRRMRERDRPNRRPDPPRDPELNEQGLTQLKQIAGDLTEARDDLEDRITRLLR